MKISTDDTDGMIKDDAPPNPALLVFGDGGSVASVHQYISAV